LFQDRFKSEAVESDEYFLMVLRYIHQNPIKAGGAVTYQWSSYREYLEENILVDTDFALGIFSPEKKVSVDRFEGFMNEKAEDIGIMVYGPSKLTDQEAKLAIQKMAEVNIPAELQTMEKKKRDEVLRKIKRINGITTRQIARLTGITQSIIVRA
jgi:hypothetical protein